MSKTRKNKTRNRKAISSDVPKKIPVHCQLASLAVDVKAENIQKKGKEKKRQSGTN